MWLSLPLGFLSLGIGVSSHLEDPKRKQEPREILEDARAKETMDTNNPISFI